MIDSHGMCGKDIERGSAAQVAGLINPKTKGGVA